MTPKIKERIEQINHGKVPEGYKKTCIGIIPTDWETARFKNKFNRLMRKNTVGSTNVLTISAQLGLVSQEEFFNKTVASDDKTNYFLLNRGEYAYNKSYSNGYPFGAIKRLDKYEQGIVSPLYICFSASNENKCPDFYLQYFEAGRMNSEIQAFAQKGARNHGLLNISVDDFFNAILVAPPLSEQEKITAILETQDRLIELCEKKVEQLKKLKKIFLQKMFPKPGASAPEWRFPGFADAWEQRKLGEMSESYSGGTPTVGIKEYYDGEIPFIRSAEINNDTTELFLSEEGLKNSSARLVSVGDILYALYGATSGEVGRARLKGAINQAILAIKPYAEYDTEFLAQWLRKSKRNIIETYLQGGQGNLSGTIVKELLVEFPSLQEQQQIGGFFRSLDNLITLHQRKCDEEKQKKKALMQLLLTGIVRT